MPPVPNRYNIWSTMVVVPAVLPEFVRPAAENAPAPAEMMMVLELPDSVMLLPPEKNIWLAAPLALVPAVLLPANDHDWKYLLLLALRSAVVM